MFFFWENCEKTTVCLQRSTLMQSKMSFKMYTSSLLGFFTQPSRIDDEVDQVSSLPLNTLAFNTETRQLRISLVRTHLARCSSANLRTRFKGFIWLSSLWIVVKPRSSCSRADQQEVAKPHDELKPELRVDARVEDKERQNHEHKVDLRISKQFPSFLRVHSNYARWAPFRSRFSSCVRTCLRRWWYLSRMKRSVYDLVQARISISECISLSMYEMAPKLSARASCWEIRSKHVFKTIGVYV